MNVIIYNRGGNYIYQIKRFTTIFHFVLCCWSCQVIAQQFQFQNFSVNNGLGQSQVFCLLEDSKGYIWMGTRGGGLSRYDGMNFTRFGDGELTSNYIWSMAEDQSGNLWIGTDNSLMKYDGEKFIYVETPFRNSPITFLKVIDNRLWIGSTKGLMQCVNGEFDHIAMKYKGLVSAIDMHDGLLWVGSDAGVLAYSYPGCDSVIYQFDESNGLNEAKVRSLHSTAQGLWIGTYGGGVNLFARDTLLDANQFILLENSRVHTILQKDEDLYFGTQQWGVCRFNLLDSTSEMITDQKGLANNHVRSLLNDSWGNLWIGTSGGGVSKFQGRTFDYFKQENGLAGDYIYAIEKDCEGRIWVSTSGNGLSIIDHKVIIEYEPMQELRVGKIKAIHHALDSSIWIGYDGQGIARVDTDTIVYLKSPEILKSGYIRDFTEDGFGNMWVATAGGGISEINYSQGRIAAKIFGRNEGLPSVRVNKLLIDQLNRIWFATVSGGIGYIENDTIGRTWSLSQGLTDSDVISMVEDNRGFLWLGTSRSGINRLTIYSDSIRVDTFNIENGLSSNICYQLVLDENDNLWVGSEKGVEKLTIDQNGKVIEFKLFGYDEGFQGVETTQNASLLDDNGQLWFGSINGLSRFNAIEENDHTPLPKIHVEWITVNSVRQDIRWLHYELPFDSNLIAMNVVAISQYKSADIRYKHRVVGLSESWSNPSSNSILNYAGLLPGRYQMEVVASLDQESWTQPIIATFVIDKPIWKKTWFIASYMFLIGLIIWGFVFIRIRSFKSKLREKEKQLSLEKEVLELEQKALRLQMNPHFIFNALNSIQAMISRNDPKTARLYLAKFSKLMRQVLENSRMTYITLDREIETLENYLSIERFCHANRFEFSIEVSDKLDIETIEIPPIIIQPFVENAIVHGVSQVAVGGKVSIIFGKADDFLVCTIIDNGIGRQAASKMQSQQGQKHKSTALLITQERLDRLNSPANLNSIDIEDLLDIYGKAMGTKVSVRIKLR